MKPKRGSESATEMVEVVLPNDANPLGFMLGGNVMRLIDFAGAVTAIRHARAPMVTAAVSGDRGRATGRASREGPPRCKSKTERTKLTTVVPGFLVRRSAHREGGSRTYPASQNRSR